MRTDRARVGDVEDALRAAQSGRVCLGAFSADELWDFGVPLPGVGVSPDAPMTDEVPDGPRMFRQAMRPPRAVFSTASAAPEADWEHVNRFGELVGPDLVRVRETTDRNRTFELSFQPLRLLVETAMDDAGLLDTARDARHTRLLAAFPFRMVPATVRGVRRFTQEPYPLAERRWMQVVVDHAPGSIRVAETRSAQASGFRRLKGDAGPDVVAHVLAFYRSYWPELPS